VADAVRHARRSAERSVELDALDPFANLTMGRCFWLEGDPDAGFAWLDRATAISPSYAQGIYARAWTHALSGRGTAGKADADLAMALSPLDPLHYAMAATRALSHIVCGETEDAAAWAERAARSPGAHVLVAVIAVAAHSLNRTPERAAAWAANVRERNPALTVADFFRSFPFADREVRQRIAKALAGLVANRVGPPPGRAGETDTKPRPSARRVRTRAVGSGRNRAVAVLHPVCHHVPSASEHRGTLRPLSLSTDRPRRSRDP